MLTKRNIKLYALKRMQTKNPNEKYEATIPPCLDKALLFKGKKT